MNYLELFDKLLNECPFGDSVDDCPFNEFRKGSDTGKSQVSFDMPAEDKAELLINHFTCKKCRDRNF